MIRVGVLGGTFDPVHEGHIGIALAVREAIGLDRVDLVPSYEPPHRPGHRPAAFWHRFAMVALAAADHPALYASDREIRRGGVSYMLDTLRGYALDEPDAVPVLILGLDAFADLPSWRRPEALVGQFDVAVASRPGSRSGEILPRLPEWLRARIVPAGDLSRDGLPASRREGGGRVALLDLPPHPVSASEVRDRIARGEEIKKLVAGPVRAYIEKYGIYSG